MKKFSFLFHLFLFTFLTAHSQILCIQCYDQNAQLNPGCSNLVLNGSFENYTGTYYFCPAFSGYNLDITNWTCTGGGTNTYASLIDGTSGLSMIGAGNHAAYMGNFYCWACTDADHEDTSCLAFDSACLVTGVIPDFPHNTPQQGNNTGVSLVQTVSGLTVGATYILEFWVGGEMPSYFVQHGIFGVDIGFGVQVFNCHGTDVGDVGRRYMIVFKATSTSHNVKFTNWGHICSTCTEAVIDDIFLYPIADATTTTANCAPVIPPGPVTHVSTTTYAFCIGDSININGTYYSQPTSFFDTVSVTATSINIAVTVILDTLCSDDIYIPNAFSPGNDGFNDLLKVVGDVKKLKSFHLEIYNRWGQKVFETNNYDEGWDGTFNEMPLSMGVFAYSLKYSFSSSKYSRLRKGNITLVR